MHVKAARAAALLLTVSGCVGAGAGLAGCGGTSSASGAAAERLQREDLTAVSHALEDAERSVGSEVAATKAAWPQVVNGLPANVPRATRPLVEAASARARAIVAATLLTEAQTSGLTGPAAGIAGLFRSFKGLAERGWTLTGAAVAQINGGPPATARFARANVGLYIESVYDGHFELALIGKSVRSAYQGLGGSAAFGHTLTQTQVDALARAYSPQADQLHPHTGVRLGS